MSPMIRLHRRRGSRHPNPWQALEARIRQPPSLQSRVQAYLYEGAAQPMASNASMQERAHQHYNLLAPRLETNQHVANDTTLDIDYLGTRTSLADTAMQFDITDGVPKIDTNLWTLHPPIVLDEMHAAEAACSRCSQLWQQIYSIISYVVPQMLKPILASRKLLGGSPSRLPEARDFDQEMFRARLAAAEVLETKLNIEIGMFNKPVPSTARSSTSSSAAALVAAEARIAGLGSRNARDDESHKEWYCPFRICSSTTPRVRRSRYRKSSSPLAWLQHRVSQFSATIASIDAGMCRRFLRRLQTSSWRLMDQARSEQCS